MAIGLLIAACGGTGDNEREIVYDPCAPLVVGADESADASEAKSVSEALALWRDVGVDRLTTEPVEGAPRLWIRFEDAAPMFFGLYRDEKGDIFVNSRFEDPEGRAVIIAHEIGHAFGLDHVDEDRRDSVMNEANTTTPPTRDDVTFIFERWEACPPLD